MSTPEINTSARAATMKDGARREFDRWSESYDRSWLNELVFFPCIRRCLEEILRWQRNRAGAPFDVLDVGCGTASLLVELSRQPGARKLLGVDYSPAMVERAHEKLRRLQLDERVEVLSGDAEHLPFRDASLDIVTCCNSFHHYPHQDAAIREFRRVLRSGGMLVLIDGFRDNVVGWIVFDVAVAWAEKNVHHAPWSEIRAHIGAAGFATLTQHKMNVLAPLLVNVASA